jgi:hypothetical protein
VESLSTRLNNSTVGPVIKETVQEQHLNHCVRHRARGRGVALMQGTGAQRTVTMLASPPRLPARFLYDMDGALNPTFKSPGSSYRRSGPALILNGQGWRVPHFDRLRTTTLAGNLADNYLVRGRMRGSRSCRVIGPQLRSRNHTSMRGQLMLYCGVADCDGGPDTGCLAQIMTCSREDSRRHTVRNLGCQITPLCLSSGLQLHNAL